MEKDEDPRTVHAQIPYVPDREIRVSTMHNDTDMVDIREYRPSLDIYGRGVTVRKDVLGDVCSIVENVTEENAPSDGRKIHGRIPLVQDKQLHVSVIPSPDGTGLFVDIREYIESLDLYGRGVTYPYRLHGQVKKGLMLAWRAAGEGSQKKKPQ